MTKEDIIKELTKSIQDKLSQITENINLKKGPTGDPYIQLLMAVDDELEDILLNWSESDLEIDDLDLDFDDF
jgi:hypothetical protein